jgi:hypothetical protein
MTQRPHRKPSGPATLALVIGAWVATRAAGLHGSRAAAAEPQDIEAVETDRPASPRTAAPRQRSADDVPSVDELCRRAVEAALAEPDRARSFVNRARLAGGLPETTLRVYRRFARTEGVTFEDPVTGAAVPVDIKAIDDVRYEWRATWDLSRIVFNPDEISAHFEALRMADVRRDIQMLVIRLFFERKRLLLEVVEASAAGVAGSAGAEKRSLRIVEIEAQLDALSRGALSAHRAAASASAHAPVSPPW